MKNYKSNPSVICGVKTGKFPPESATSGFGELINPWNFFAWLCGKDRNHYLVTDGVKGHHGGHSVNGTLSSCCCDEVVSQRTALLLA